MAFLPCFPAGSSGSPTRLSPSRRRVRRMARSIARLRSSSSTSTSSFRCRRRPPSSPGTAARLSMADDDDGYLLRAQAIMDELSNEEWLLVLKLKKLFKILEVSKTGWLLRSPGYGISLVAKTTSGCLIFADAAVCFTKEDMEHFEDSEEKPELSPPEDLGVQVGSMLLGEIEQGGVVDSTHQESYSQQMTEKYAWEDEQPQLDPEVWVAASGVPKKGHVYGFGHSMDTSRVLSGASSSASHTSAFNTGVGAPVQMQTQVIDALQAQLSQSLSQVISQALSQLS
ncbi:hypothetical protein Taro_050401 [Colocasia esculenta]|uniref:RNA 3'-terminal phosphate cyclase insert domain-containing protein n=1 Tax=Colocasia esculenta TaxID=4460 RepID=A0A843XDC3_COLES|nr:hypothetical protein [Colocasia esculenta]